MLSLHLRNNRLSIRWLYATPISSCGLRLDDEVFRIAVGLRLGVDNYETNSCVCGELVDVRGSHAISCKRNSGRIIRYNYLNNIIHRSLNHPAIPAIKEPQGLSRYDGKRLDSLTLISWREGRCLIWDITVADIIATYHLPTTDITARSADESAATHKLVKYEDLSQNYTFVTNVIESRGTFSNSALDFL